MTLIPARFLRLVPLILLPLLLLPAAASAQESWDVIMVQGKRIGSINVKVVPLKDRQGRALARVLVTWDLNFKRGTDAARVQQEWGTIETPDGAILKLEVRTKSGETVTTTAGEVVGSVMKLRVEGGAQVQQQDIPWSSDIRGPYGAELSLSRKKLEPGQTRTVKTFLPDLNKVCLTKLVAGPMEEVELGGNGEKRPLLRVEQSVAELDGTERTEMSSTLWVDASGQILKSHSAMLGGTDFYRTTAAGAAMGADRANFDLLAASIVPTKRINTPDKTRSVVYKVTMQGKEPAKVFPSDARQTVTPGGSKDEVSVAVRSLGPVDGSAVPAPGEEFLRPNPWVNSDDARVVSHSRRAVGREVDPWAKAAAIEAWVAKNLSEKNFGIAFNNAANVAQNLSGDCTEHSVLVAAMCRAAGIPSRCVVGIVYVQKNKAHEAGFGPHMWNEVYVNNRWVAIDAAFDQSRVDATHIKLADTSLDGISPFETFLPVLSMFDKMKIEPVEVDGR